MSMHPWIGRPVKLIFLFLIKRFSMYRHITLTSRHFNSEVNSYSIFGQKNFISHSCIKISQICKLNLISLKSFIFVKSCLSLSTHFIFLHTFIKFPTFFLFFLLLFQKPFFHPKSQKVPNFTCFWIIFSLLCVAMIVCPA